MSTRCVTSKIRHHKTDILSPCHLYDNYSWSFIKHWTCQHSKNWVALHILLIFNQNTASVWNIAQIRSDNETSKYDSFTWFCCDNIFTCAQVSCDNESTGVWHFYLVLLWQHLHLCTGKLWQWKYRCVTVLLVLLWQHLHLCTGKLWQWKYRCMTVLPGSVMTTSSPVHR